MPSYTAPLEQIRFVLHDVLDYPQLTGLPGYEEATPDVVDAVLEEAAKLCQEVLAPLNLPGDTEGCHLENGVVRTPRGFKEAYRTFVEGGWAGLTASPEWGGQGLPHVLTTVFGEMMSAANMAFGMYPGLSQGAAHALELHGSPEQKALYLPKMTSGAWTGTMNLTEPHCGTDLGLIRTKAEPRGDGTYAITGTKIFISAGEHDLAENIVHLVLAKLPDAPPGVKGISLFIVPKYLPKEENGQVTVGPRNALQAGSIEHKMGIRANATAVMNYDGATGWLVGEPHKGLRSMFAMMNAARLGVAIQGLGVADVAYQNSLAYAKDRLQGRSLTGAKAPEKPADPILVHPDVRRMLLEQKAFVEGGRALAYWTGMQLDLMAKHPDAGVREAADDLVGLMTPVLKAYLTDKGYESATIAQQVLGGHGYIHEWGMEQFVRDARIAMIYEGANGIQALDLVGRKLPAHGGRALTRFMAQLEGIATELKGEASVAEFLPAYGAALARLQQATQHLFKGLTNPDEAGAASTDYLHLFALVAMGYMWLRMARAAGAKLAQGANGNAAFYGSKLKTARFFFTRMLPQSEARFQALTAGAKVVMEVAEGEF